MSISLTSSLNTLIDFSSPAKAVIKILFINASPADKRSFTIGNFKYRRFFIA